jgi:cyclophilin family peptidyl-prolyl cis-trans isomerase/predicted DsbA family dithiol-disulfide isomerase
MNRALMRKIICLCLLMASVILLYACSPEDGRVTPKPPAASPPTSMVTSTPANMACRLLHSPATPSVLGAEFGERGHIAGSSDAPVTIVVFSNYQCPACAILGASLKQIRVTHANDVRLIYVNIPQSGLDKDTLAFQAVEAADLQEKFWEMHDLLFEKQSEWISLSPTAFKAWVMQKATDLGNDPLKFQTDFESNSVAERLQQAMQTSADQSISLPALFVNSSSRYTGLADFPSLDTVVRMEALSARQFSACPAWVIDPLKQYIATLHTARGDVVIQLYPDKAPQAVNNFVFLSQKGFYNGVTFYKVTPGSIVMTGDPSDTGMGNPGYLFTTEISAKIHFDQPGLVAMDNSGPNTNGSRFLITLAPADNLYERYTIIGKVVSGMEVLSALAPRDPRPGLYLPAGDTLFKVAIQEQ